MALDQLVSQEPSADLVDRLRMALIPGIGPRLLKNLLEAFGNHAAILSAPIGQLKEIPGIGPKLATAIATAHNREAALAEWERCRQHDVAMVAVGETGYPELLAEVADPPEILYRRGTWHAQDALSVAIVGSRHCTIYGLRIAERLAGGLARAGVTVVSGLARGIDAAAHRGALKAGGRTIAVTGHGLGHVYPPEHADLSLEVAASGAIVSEYHFSQPPMGGLFPQRNRIISGLSLGVIVIEAGRGSGALHTARHATEQNREVFAVPGQIDSDASLGCLDLLRDGATLIRDVDDVLSALGPLARPVVLTDGESSGGKPVVHQPRELLLSDVERLVLQQVSERPTSVDEVIRGLEIESSRVLATLTILEMKRLIKRHPGACVSRY